MTKLPSGQLEDQVLAALWESDDGLTPRQVHGLVATDRPLAYTTVMTILVRLWRKGLAERERTGRAFTYRARVSREERAAARMSDLLSAAGDPSAALTHFVQSLDVDQLADLRNTLRRPRHPS